MKLSISSANLHPGLNLKDKKIVTVYDLFQNFKWVKLKAFQMVREKRKQAGFSKSDPKYASLLD